LNTLRSCPPQALETRAPGRVAAQVNKQPVCIFANPKQFQVVIDLVEQLVELLRV
jgi:hypothetical protein